MLPAVRGVLHRARGRDALVLTHGAGGAADAPILVDLATAFQDAGVTVLRCDLPYRQARRHGPPSPGDAARDRAGLRHAVDAMRELTRGRVFLGGASYGGRQASVLAAAQPGLVDALLLLAYPLHRPARPDVLRTEHFVDLRTPALFVHGDHDPFGSIAELEAARGAIPARTEIVVVKGGHDLGYGCSAGEERDLVRKVVGAFTRFLAAP